MEREERRKISGGDVGGGGKMLLEGEEVKREEWEEVEEGRD